MRDWLFDNSAARRIGHPEAPADGVLEFHRRLPGYTPSPLVEVPGIAATLGVGRVWVKDESSRLGLPAFKILGASWVPTSTAGAPSASLSNASPPCGP